MSKKYYPFLLRFILFFVAFAVAFFLMTFLVDKNPGHDFKLWLIKIGILAIVASSIYNILIESDPEIVE